MNASTLLGISGGIITVGGLIVVVISGFRRQNTQEQNNIITIQQNEIKAYKDSNDRLKQDNAALSAENVTLKNGNKDLKDLAQQTPEIRKLIREMVGSRMLLMKVVTHLGIKDAEN
jgi:hypothetical protein